MGEPSAIEVEIAYSPRPGEVDRRTMTVAAGTTVGEAIALSGWALPEGLAVGLWGRLCAPGDVLRDSDRIELYRPLAVDPKEARRKRYRARGTSGRR